MQLTNIARDVGEDARAGRLYLPRQWLIEAGIDPEAFLADPVWSPALAGVVARLLAVADTLYARGERGIGALPPSCRPAITAARLLYAEIGRQLERDGLDPVARRAVVPGRRKAVLLARAVWRAAWPGAADPAPALPETRFLVQAVAAGRAPWPLRSRGGVRGRALWVLDLFEHLQRREMLARARP
jgi:phytoene synthase